ncbi:ABC transporter substrate-binding protein [Natrinema halophilum]|uniref:ABC transporter substrate-binding protein n=1 Tax=Natrinema halophilum TaxID=1699371 RepID=UPI001F4786A9|nr:ABC transporter substrate-binding protein [Natrinema halophilum]UHQ96287.1 ABC transporter substrate-binding protein [Natrinema halophilum]
MGLSGCLGNSGSDDETLKIGVIGVHSGVFSSMGPPLKRGANLAAKQINEEDEGYNVEVIHEDSEGNPDTAVTRARKLIEEDNVDAITGMETSNSAIAVSEFCASRNTLLVCNTQSMNLQMGDCQRTTFRAQANLTDNARSTADILINEYGDEIDTIAGINPDYTFGHESWEEFTSYMDENHDVEVAYETFTQLGKGNYQNEIQAIMDAEPDVLYSALFSGDLVTFLQQGNNVDLFEMESLQSDDGPNFCAVGTGSFPDVPAALGADMPECLLTATYYPTFPDTEVNNNFVSSFQEEYDRTPVGISSEGYQFVDIVKEGADKAGSKNTDDIVDALEGFEYEAPEGKIRLREEDHQGIQEYTIQGRMGPVDEFDFYGLAEMMPVEGESVAVPPSSECSLVD